MNESADWYNAKYIAVMGANLNMTRTPDVHFAAEARHNGTKMVVFSPDFSQVSKYADQWIPVHAGQDGAFWMAVTHIILKEFHYEKKSPYFIDYCKRYTDSPFLVELIEEKGEYKPGKFLRANRTAKYKDVENGDWKFLNLDAVTLNPVMPKGSVGHRWDAKTGNWNMKFEDGLDNTSYEPLLSFIDHKEGVVQLTITEFGLNIHAKRSVPVRYIDTMNGKVPVTTVYDLMMAQYGVGRDLPGEYPLSY